MFSKLAKPNANSDPEIVRVNELLTVIRHIFLQLTSWLYELKSELASEEVSETLEGAERLIEQFSTQRDSTLDACASTIAEGKTLLEELK
jgi:hypothetical protein